ncbi:MAG: molybdate ABC transporter permease subunit [Cyanobacteria bacterium J06621_8]
MYLDLSPLWISLQTALVATIFAVTAGIMVAKSMFQYQGKAKGLLDGILTLPLVLPPIVIGFLLLLLFGRNSIIGQLLQQWGTSIIFSWQGTVIASTVVAFPLMYKSALGAFEQVDRDLLNCARTLGAGENRIFWQIIFPLSWRGIIAGIILTFARALGEFGATLMLAGNIPGRTQTMPLAIYFAAEAGRMGEALIWVAILVAIALGVITTINYWSSADSLFDRLLDSLGASAISRWTSIIIRWLNLEQSQNSLESRVKPSDNSGDRQELLVTLEHKLSNFSLTTNFNADRQPMGILGASGSGKSMTLRCIAGLETPATGTIVLNGRILFDSRQNINVPCRQRRIGFVFQNYALFPNMRVARNVGFGLQHLSKAARRKQVKKYLDLMQLQGLEKRYPHQLSGGQQQRVALARALAMEPEAILLDEPLSALDNYLRSQIEQLLTDVFASYPGIVLFVTHKLEEAYRLCQNLLILDGGEVIGFGNKQNIFQQPPNFKVAQLTECKNFSNLQIVDYQTIKALNWHCKLQIMPQPPTLLNSLKYIGIRAHHLRFRTSSEAIEAEINTFPCWLVRVSETPHRMTLYLKLHSAANHKQDYHLRGEVFREKWEMLKNQSFPWYVCLDPQKLILMSH